MWDPSSVVVAEFAEGIWARNIFRVILEPKGMQGLKLEKYVIERNLGGT